jgi:phage gpG-like protein
MLRMARLPSRRKVCELLMRGMSYVANYINQLRRFFTGKSAAVVPPRQGETNDVPQLPSPDSPDHPFHKLAAKFVARVRADVVEGFASSTDPSTGKSWAPRKDNLKHPLLIKTGLLLTNAIAAIDATKPVVEGNMIEAIISMQNDPFYAKFHQFGTKKMVARSFFGFSQSTYDDIAESATELAVRITFR